MGRDVDEKMCTGKKKFYLSPFRQEAWVVQMVQMVQLTGENHVCRFCDQQAVLVSLEERQKA